MRPIVFAALLSGLLALSPPAWAQGQGNGNGNGNGHDAGHSENAGSQGNGQSGNGQPGNSQAGKAGDGPATGPARELSETDALAAVEAGRAVELSVILPDVRSRTGGEVINAQLQQVGGVLIYAVTVLTPSGQVLTEHYYARTGAYVGR